MTADVVVIGAGCAGLSAACRLAEAGLVVVVAEEAPRLGGRATAFSDRETGERVDNGQHVLFGCYHDTYEYLRRVGTAQLAPLQTRLSLTMASIDGRTSQFTCPDLRPPWHLVAGVLGWSALSLIDRMSALRMASTLNAVRRVGAEAVAAGVPGDLTVSQWLAAHGQSPQLCTWLWNPLAIAALNQSADIASAPPFVRVLGELFGPRSEDAAVGLPAVPLDELFAEPARRFIEARGGTVLTKSPARVIVASGHDGQEAVTGVAAGTTVISTSAVISAVPWHAFGRLWDTPPPPSLRDIATRAAAMPSSPIVTVNLWLDGPALAAPFVGLIGGPMHWVFDKSAIFGNRAGHLSIVASGAQDLVAMTNAEITSIAMTQLKRALPAVAERAPLRSVVVREQRATFSLAPGVPARPATETPMRGLFLAGDWTDTGLPATIEGAIRSGHAAAKAVLSKVP